MVNTMLNLVLACIAATFLTVVLPAEAQPIQGSERKPGQMSPARIASDLTDTAVAGPASETLAQVARKVLSVQSFGAKCDGVTDDTNAFLSMVTTAPAGNVLIVGTCLIS